jgi:DNA-binding NarL/FixJ family response regulator
MTRLLIADDHPAYRRGLELMLVGTGDIEIVGEADTGERAIFTKLQVSERSQAIVKAREAGLGGG